MRKLLLKSRLDKFRVEVVKYPGRSSQYTFGCKSCGIDWDVKVLPNGHMPKGYWKCPKGCNTDMKG